MEDLFGLSIPLLAIASIFIGLPWLILHYVTKWRQAPRITEEDERLLDEMHQLARRLEERLQTVERIIAADNPDFRLPPQQQPSQLPGSDYDYARRN